MSSRRGSQSSHGVLWLPGTCGRKGTREPKRSQEVPRGGRKVRAKVSHLSTNFKPLIFSAHVELECIIHSFYFFFFSFAVTSFFGAVQYLVSLKTIFLIMSMQKQITKQSHFDTLIQPHIWIPEWSRSLLLGIIEILLFIRFSQVKSWIWFTEPVVCNIM